MTSVNTATSSTNSSTKRYTGLVSNLDTDSIVKGMTSSTRNKIAKQLQDRQILSWKTDAYRSISKKLVAFSEKFISYTSSSNLFSEKFFENSTISSKGTNGASVTATGSSDGLKGLSILSVDELAASASFMTSKNASKQVFSTGDIDFSAEGRTINNLAGETINLKYDGKYYNVVIPKNFTGTTPTEIETVFNDALKNVTLADGVTTLDSLVQLKASGSNVQLSPKDSSKTLAVVGGSGSSLKALGITAGASSATSTITGEIKTDNMTKKIVFNDIIKGKSMTFDLNGIQKTIKFSDTASFSDIGALKTYIQDELNKSFGLGKIQVESDSNELKFSTADTTSVLTFVNADTGLAGSKGILNLETRSSNRLRLDRPLYEVASSLGIADPTEVTDDQGNKVIGYKITVNGKDFTFSRNKAISEVISTINNADAGINIKYLSTTDKFSVTATETGSHGKVSISDAAGGGNLISTLMGVEGTGASDYKIKNGTDAKMNVSFDGGPSTTLTRTSNAFTLDGTNITINSKFDSTKASGGDAITFSTKQNTDEILKGIKEMVTAYNEVVDLVNTEVSTKRNRNYAPLTSEQEDDMTESQVKDWNDKAKTGLLFGDSQLRSLSTELRFAFSFAVPEVGNISDFGITTASAYKDNGKIVIDETKLKAAIEERPDDVKKLFTMPKSTAAGATDSDAGIMTRVKKVFDKYAATTGEKGSLIKLAGLENSVTTTDSSLYKQIASIDLKVTALKKTLTTEEDRYYSQFTSLEKYISQMNAQSSWLTQQSSS